MDNIGQRLKEERQLRGWSQRDLARETGVNTDTISGIETGQHEPRPSTLRKLAEGLGIEVRDFFMEPVLPKAPAREAGQPKEIAAAVSQTAEEVADATFEVAQEVAGPPSERDVNVIHLESRDEIAKFVSEIVWSLPESEDRRLVVNIHEDDSADIHIMPSSTTERSRARKKRAEK